MIGALLSLFYPPTCAGCLANVKNGEHLCRDCHASAARIIRPFCQVCSEPFSGEITGSFTCANCADRTLHFEAAVSGFRSRGIVRRVIHQFKYGGAVQLRHVVTQWLEATFDDERLAGRTFDLFVPVPLHPARQRERGFNQAETLARLLSGRRGIPCQPVLKRVRYTTTQTAFDRTERMNNLRDAFRLRKNADVRQSRVLLIDDILTTGATLSECARVLKDAGAASVYAATAARA